jgi:uncharacterized delta-60 repeat protein
MVRTPPLVLEQLEDREVPAVGLDTTFGTGGFVLDPAGTNGLFQSVVGAVATPGGQVVVVGNTPASGASASGTVALTRLTATGAVDPTFGTGGVDALAFPAPHVVTTVVEQSDGKILLGGTFVNATGTDVSPDVFVLRLNADGTRDATFGTGGETDFTFNAAGTIVQPATDALAQLAVAPDGSIVFAGTLIWPSQDYSPTGSQLVVGRLHANGTPDTTFGYDPPGIVRGEGAFPWSFGGMAIQPDGKIVVAGTAAPDSGPEPSPNPTNSLVVFRFTADGIYDEAFGSGGTAQPQGVSAREETATSVAVLSDGRIVVGGDTPTGQGVLDWFGGNGAFQGEDQSGSAPSGGGLKQVDQVLPAPTGGAEVVGVDLSGGLGIERHTGPGAAAVDRVVVNPGGLAAPTALLFDADGSALVVGHTGVDTFAADAAPSLALTRFTNPGTTASTATVVQPEETTQPAGTVSLAAQVQPLVGAGPVTGGTLTFREGATVLGTAPVSAAGVPLGASLILPPGDHTITVDYSGTAEWAASRATYTLHLTPNHTPTVAVSVSDTNPALGEPLALTATVRAPDGSIPTGGTVTFFVEGLGVGTAPLDATGTARFALASYPGGVGPSEVFATFNDPGADLNGVSAAVTVNASRAFAAVGLGASAATGTLSAGEPVTLTATVTVPTSTGVTPTGKVTFYAGSTALGTAAVGATGTATLTTTGLVRGTAALRASYSGDGNVQGEMSAPLWVTVGRAVTTTALAVPTGVVAAGQPVTLTATVRATGAFPIGSVEFLDGTTVLGTAAVNGRGQATLTLAALGAGPHTLTAVYSGSSMCGTSASAAQTVTVSGTTVTPGATATTTTLTTSVAAPVFDQDQTLTATVVTAAGPVTGGTVAFYDGQTLLGSAAVDANGTAALAAALNLGGHRLRAVYAGSAGLASSSSAPLAQTVAKAPTTVTLSPVATVLRATVRAAYGGAPIGTVTFMDGAIVLGTARVNGNGVAVLAAGAIRPGVGPLTAVYSGSSCFTGATSAALDVAPG